MQERWPGNMSNSPEAPLDHTLSNTRQDMRGLSETSRAAAEKLSTEDLTFQYTSRPGTGLHGVVLAGWQLTQRIKGVLTRIDTLYRYFSDGAVRLHNESS